MSILFFDTETTGLPKRRLPLNDKSQPHIVQLGAIVTDQNGRVKSELNLIIRPEGWVIPEETTKIHGITQADAEKYGVNIKGELMLFSRLASACDIFVAHNVSFDLEMMAIQTDRLEMDIAWPERSFCTMKEAKAIVKAPLTEKQVASGFTGFKSPNLQESYTHFFGKPFEGAHDAMADVRACRDVYFALQGGEAKAA